MNRIEFLKLTQSQEYEDYITALCRLASNYVSRIRVQFAEKAVEMYQNETVRKLVIEYGKEYEKLQNSRLRDFRWISDTFEQQEVIPADRLEDSCINYAGSYGRTIFFLFGIE